MENVLIKKYPIKYNECTIIQTLYVVDYDDDDDDDDVPLLSLVPVHSR